METLQMDWPTDLLPSLPCANKTFTIAVNKYAKSGVRYQNVLVLSSFIVFFTLLQVFCPGLSENFK